MSFEAPYYTYSKVKKRAEIFLEEFHPSRKLPIPIEEIIDVKMGINIFPFPRLYKDHGLNGFLTANRDTIYVDEIQYDSYIEKFRYTIAHELGHYVLHKSYYKDLNFSNIKEYKKWRMSLPLEELDWFETHADWFAGLVLVPTICLEKVCYEVINKYHDHLKKVKNSEDVWSYASNEIARYFCVNAPVVEIRIRKENFIYKIKI
ncbi:MAG: ImmA/IrrE family metallo-endopeptidase [Thermoplasmatales archaeon]|nr:MAG: ImmA/IrrE family metallo-endopeptidase [Thermoplasmatales archaeon]